jgi:hypothetical protein
MEKMGDLSRRAKLIWIEKTSEHSSGDLFMGKI